MKKKLNKILLVDDSESDNFIHARKIRKADVAENIIIQYDGQSALDYLTTRENGHYPRPELLFLDINMPGMNGWEFLEAYEKLPVEQKAGVVVCMLTTSVSERDEEKAASYPQITAFERKPLTEEMLRILIERHYPNYLN